MYAMSVLEYKYKHRHRKEGTERERIRREKHTRFFSFYIFRHKKNWNMPKQKWCKMCFKMGSSDIVKPIIERGRRYERQKRRDRETQNEIMNGKRFLHPPEKAKLLQEKKEKDGVPPMKIHLIDETDTAMICHNVIRAYYIKMRRVTSSVPVWRFLVAVQSASSSSSRGKRAEEGLRCQRVHIKTSGRAGKLGKCKSLSCGRSLNIRSSQAGHRTVRTNQNGRHGRWQVAGCCWGKARPQGHI